MTAEHPSPADPPPGPRPAWRRRAWFRARALARSERFWRLAASLAFVFAAVSARVDASAARDDARDAEAAASQVVEVQRSEEAARCQQRIESRQAIRDAIDVAVAAVATYAQLDAAQQAELAELVSTKVYEALPPPEC